MRCIKTCKKSQKKTVKNGKFAQQTKNDKEFFMKTNKPVKMIGILSILSFIVLGGGIL